jgi:hypothetical protein
MGDVVIADDIKIKQLLNQFAKEFIIDILQGCRERVFVFSTLVGITMVITKFWYPHLHEMIEYFAISYLGYKKGN